MEALIGAFNKALIGTLSEYFSNDVWSVHQCQYCQTLLGAQPGSSIRSPNWSFSSDCRTHNTHQSSCGRHWFHQAQAAVRWVLKRNVLYEKNGRKNSLVLSDPNTVNCFRFQYSQWLPVYPDRVSMGLFYFKDILCGLGVVQCHTARVWDQNLIKIWKGCLTFCCRLPPLHRS